MPATEHRINLSTASGDLVPDLGQSETRYAHVHACSCLGLANGIRTREDTPISAMDEHPHPTPEPQPAPSAAPLYSDVAHCPCGAPAAEGELCRKCQARAAWDRRQAQRRRHEKPRRSGSTRPAGRTRSNNHPRGRDADQ